MLPKKLFLMMSLVVGLTATHHAQAEHTAQAQGEGIECDLMMFKQKNSLGSVFKVKEDTDLVLQKSGLFEATYNSEVTFQPPISKEYGIINFGALLNDKTLAGSQANVAYNPGALLYDNAITPVRMPQSPMHDRQMECPNECCVDVELPLDCSISPPCDLEGACACYPPLPELLDATKQPKFVNKLVNILDDDYIFRRSSKEDCGKNFYTISRVPFIADLGIVDDTNQPLFTPMFGYANKNQLPTYPGRTFIVDSYTPIDVKWENKLLDPNTGMPLPQLTYLPVDQTIHIAMPMDPAYPDSGIPTIAHLHGGFTEYLSDGHPEAWATPNFAQVGPFFAKEVFTFDNAQEAMMLWYHDHALGYTRLNNYSGLIGTYIIRGNPEKQLIEEHKIPSGPYEVPLIIADKKFTADGQMFFDYCDPEGNPCEPQPSALPEFFGDFILVNGKAWPYLEVEPRCYRLRFLNACDSRFLDLTVTHEDSLDPICFSQIGTDQGLINTPVTLSDLLLAPSQRADVVINFKKFEGQTLIVRNTANTPFPDGDEVNYDSAGLVMAFKVTKPYNKQHPKTHLPKKLREHSIKRLKPTAPNRQVILFESTDQYCRIFPLLGTPALGGLKWDDPITETPLLGTTEIWEIYNTTEDAHPIHLHSGNFEILDRQYFNAIQDPATGAITNIEFVGSPIPPSPAEQQGRFDSVIVYPKPEGNEEILGQMTRIIMNFTLPGDYVWHCHILSHEDNEMMRPLLVVPPPAIIPVSRSFLFNATKGDVLQLNVTNKLPFNAAFVDNSSIVVRKVG